MGMSRTRSTARRRVSVAVITSITLLFTLAQAPAAEASSNSRWARKLMRIVNQTRTNHGLRPLKMQRSLNSPSRHHTNKMIDDNRLYDPPNLAQILQGYPYDDLGADVVGCGNTLRELHRIMMTEAFHRSIILNHDLRRVGIGVVRARQNNRCGRGSMWATEIMYG
jgi:uncharacterized protein YkwD